MEAKCRGNDNTTPKSELQRSRSPQRWKVKRTLELGPGEVLNRRSTGNKTTLAQKGGQKLCRNLLWRSWEVTNAHALITL